MATTFLQDPGSARAEGWISQLTSRWEPERAWGVRDRDRWVATLRTEPRFLTVPASPGWAAPRAGRTAEIPVDALTNVTVAATHRRQGLMSQMLHQSLQAAKERGEVLSVLIAAEWPIYGRFGYAPATLSSDYVLHRSRRGARCDGNLAAVRQVDRGDLAGLIADVFNRARAGWSGQMDRTPEWWARKLGEDGARPLEAPPPNWFVHEGEDGIDGVLGWTPEGSPSLQAPEQRVIVDSLFTASDAAYRDLWAYLTGVDGVDQVQLSGRPAREPVSWLLDDARSLVLLREVDFLWLRFLDLAAALRARQYATPGELVLEVNDPYADGFAAGRYRLIATDDGAECETTSAPADLEISQRTLASAYLGGFRLAELASAGGVTELRTGGLQRADVMFSWSRPPWNATWF